MCDRRRPFQTAITSWLTLGFLPTTVTTVTTSWLFDVELISLIFYFEEIIMVVTLSQWALELGTWASFQISCQNQIKKKEKKKVIIKSLCHQNWLWLSEAELYQTGPLREVRSLQLMDTNSCSLKKK